MISVGPVFVIVLPAITAKLSAVPRGTGGGPAAWALLASTSESTAGTASTSQRIGKAMFWAWAMWVATSMSLDAASPRRCGLLPRVHYRPTGAAVPRT